MVEPTNSIRRLTIAGWRQFRRVDIELHPKLTILTGSNGAGKTTLLNIFAQQLGRNRSYLATPTLNLEGSTVYSQGVFEEFAVPSDQIPGTLKVGEITYTSGQKASIVIPKLNSVQYGLNFVYNIQIPGLIISSHRNVPNYQVVQNIPTAGVLPEQAYTNYLNSLTSQEGQGFVQQNTLYRLKEALISMALFGQGNNYVSGISKLLAAYTGFSDILKQILPSAIGFESLIIRPPDVVLKTSSGDFIIDAASGGINAVIDMAWQIYMFSIDHEKFLVVIDEPENHLHPSMQRSLLANLTNAFPSVKFIVATHSPFIVTSVKDSSVYVLHPISIEQSSELWPNPNLQAIESQRLDLASKGGSASDTLRDVLGVRSTIPLWAEEELNIVVSKYRNKEVTGELLDSLRLELRELGFGEWLSQALEQIIPDA